MVAEERMKVADLEDELRERASEREALKLAMKILEEENQRFRGILASASQAVRNVKVATPIQHPTPSPSRNHSRQSSKSSSLSIPIVPSNPGSPRTSPQYLTPGESPWVEHTTYPGKAPTTVDFSEDKKIIRPQPATRSLPPPLEVDGWADSPGTPYYTSAPHETIELDEDPPTARLTT